MKKCIICGKKFIKKDNWSIKYFAKRKFCSNKCRCIDLKGKHTSPKTEFKKGKLTAHKVDEARKEAGILINDLIEFSQRCDLVYMERGKMRLKFKEGVAELLNSDGKSFLFKNNAVFKITNKIENSNMEEVSQTVEAQKKKKEVEINPKVFEIIRKELGEFEIVL